MCLSHDDNEFADGFPWRFGGKADGRERRGPRRMSKIEIGELLAIEVDVRPAVDLGDDPRSGPCSRGRSSGRDGLVGRVLEREATGGLGARTCVLDIDGYGALVAEAKEMIGLRSAGLRRPAPEVVERIKLGDDVAGRTGLSSQYRLTDCRMDFRTALGWGLP
jgi:hypothetical protein